MVETKHTGLTLKESGIIFIHFCLILITVFQLFFFFTTIKDIKSSYHLNEYQKIKIKIDSTRIGSIGSGSGREKRKTLYYSNPKGELTLSYRYSRAAHNMNRATRTYLKARDYSEIHHDSIYVWYHKYFKNYYAEENSTTVKNAIEKYFFLKRKIFFSIAIFYIIWIIYFFLSRK